MLPSSSPLKLPTRLRNCSATVIFGVWFVATSALGAWMVAQHVVALPPAVFESQAPGFKPLAWHILGADCGCSKSVAHDLASRGPREGWAEKIYLVGNEPQLALTLRKAGFDVEIADPENLARSHGIQGAPWLALFSSNGKIAYSGGYATARPGTPGSTNNEEQLMEAVARGLVVESLPSYGCATSRALQDKLDPLRLKYSSTP